MTTFFILIELVYGFLYFLRTIEEFRTKNFINEAWMTKIVSSYLVWIFLASLFCRQKLFLFTIMLLWPIVALKVVPLLASWLHRKRFRQELLPLMSTAIVKIRMGQSFREAMLSAAQGASDFTRVKIEKLMESLAIADIVSIQEEQDHQVRELLCFFKNAEQDPHRLVARLSQYRQKMKIEAEFNLKRDRALHQLKSQSFVLSVLYFGLLTYVSLHFGFFENRKLIFTSLTMFVLGVFITQMQGRRFKWKV